MNNALIDIVGHTSNNNASSVLDYTNIDFSSAITYVLTDKLYTNNNERKYRRENPASLILYHVKVQDVEKLINVNNAGGDDGIPPGLFNTD